MNSPKKILIVRTDRIGDVVLSLPMAELVKKNYPDCKVAYFIRDYTSSLIDGNPFVDEVIIAEESEGKILFLKNLRIIKSKNYDTCVIANPTLRISLMMFFAGINNRIGTGYRWYSLLFNKKVFEHRKYGEKHELEFNINLLNKIDIDLKNFTNEIKFHLNVDQISSEKINSILIERGFKSEHKIVIIHPGSGGSSVDLPKEKLIELTRMLSKLKNVTIVITGSKNESELCREFEVGETVINLSGQLDLSLLKADLNLT